MYVSASETDVEISYEGEYDNTVTREDLSIG